MSFKTEWGKREFTFHVLVMRCDLCKGLIESRKDATVEETMRQHLRFAHPANDEGTERPLTQKDSTKALRATIPEDAAKFLELENGDNLTFVMDYRNGRRTLEVTKSPKWPEAETK